MSEYISIIYNGTKSKEYFNIELKRTFLRTGTFISFIALPNFWCYLHCTSIIQPSNIFMKKTFASVFRDTKCSIYGTRNS